MVSQTMVVAAPSGLHARPAAELVKLVKSFEGTAVSIATAARKVNASGMLSLMSLGLKQGTEITVSAEGPAEEAALKAVAEFISSIKD